MPLSSFLFSLVFFFEVCQAAPYDFLHGPFPSPVYFLQYNLSHPSVLVFLLQPLLPTRPSSPPFFLPPPGAPVVYGPNTTCTSRVFASGLRFGFFSSRLPSHFAERFFGASGPISPCSPGEFVSSPPLILVDSHQRAVPFFFFVVVWAFFSPRPILPSQVPVPFQTFVFSGPFQNFFCLPILFHCRGSFLTNVSRSWRFRPTLRTFRFFQGVDFFLFRVMFPPNFFTRKDAQSLLPPPFPPPCSSSTFPCLSDLVAFGSYPPHFSFSFFYLFFDAIPPVIRVFVRSFLDFEKESVAVLPPPPSLAAPGR